MKTPKGTKAVKLRDFSKAQWRNIRTTIAQNRNLDVEARHPDDKRRRHKRAPTRTIVPAHERMRIAKLRKFKPTVDTEKEFRLGKYVLPITEVPKP